MKVKTVMTDLVRVWEHKLFGQLSWYKRVHPLLAVSVQTCTNILTLLEMGELDLLK